MIFSAAMAQNHSANQNCDLREYSAQKQNLLNIEKDHSGQNQLLLVNFTFTVKQCIDREQKFTKATASLAKKVIILSAKQDIRDLAMQYGSQSRYTLQNKNMITSNVRFYLNRLEQLSP